MARRSLFMFAILSLLAAPARAEDEAPGPANLKITVLDQTGAALITASVTITDAAGTPRIVKVDQRGQAVVPSLETGTYTVRVEAEAFQTFEGPLTLKKGANAVTVNLPLAGLAEEVIVRTDSSDTSGNAFTSSLSEQQIAELPDDPDELEQVLMQMAGPGATMRVNGFRGGRLPPKNQIQSIRFRMNSYAADNHEAGGGFGIDIVTKPGMDGWRGMTNFGFRDESLNARNAFAPTLGAEQYRRFGINFDGPLVKGKTSLAINLEGNANYDSQTINANTPSGTVTDVVRRPDNRMSGSVRLDHQLTPSQLMRIELRSEGDERENIGVGDRDLQDRAYTRKTTENSLRFSLNGLILPKVANELKVRYEREVTQLMSGSSDPAIVVLDAFSTGGAGQQSDRRGRLLEIEDNVDFQIGKKHRMRAGLLFEGMWYHSDELRNGNGTWTFGGLDQVQLGLATTYAERVGSTLVKYSQYQGGLYVQDDYTPLKSLSLSFGLRYEAQTHLDDVWNFAPRVGFTWTPGNTPCAAATGSSTTGTSRASTSRRCASTASRSRISSCRTRCTRSDRRRARQPTAAEQVPGGARTADAVPAPGVGRRRAHVLRDAAADDELHDDARPKPAPRRERQRAADRRARSDPPRSGAGQRHRDRLDRQDPGRSPDGQRELREAREALLHGRELPAGAIQQLQRRRLRAAGEQLRPRGRVGTVVAGRAPPVLRHGQLRIADEPAHGHLHPGPVGVALQHHHRLRHEPRHGRQRPPGGVGRNSARGSAIWNLNARLSRAFGFGPQRQTDGQPRIRTGGGGGGRAAREAVAGR